MGFGFVDGPPAIAAPLVKDMHRDPTREIPVVFVQMDRTFEESISISDEVPNVIPFVAQMDPYKTYNKVYNRFQLPLLPAKAKSVHKAQGTTGYYGIVYDPGNGPGHARGLQYVACSRATELAHVTLLSALTLPMFQSHKRERDLIIAEYNRLRTTYNTNSISTTTSSNKRQLSITNNDIAQQPVVKRLKTRHTNL